MQRLEMEKKKHTAGVFTQVVLDCSCKGTVPDRARLRIMGDVALNEEKCGNESDNCKDYHEKRTCNPSQLGSAPGQ